MTWARSAVGSGVSKVATMARPPESLSETTSVNDGSATGRPLTRNRTVHATVVPGVADGAMCAVWVKDPAAPLVTVLDAGSKPLLRPGSHETICGVTTADKLCRPARIVA